MIFIKKGIIIILMILLFIFGCTQKEPSIIINNYITTPNISIDVSNVNNLTTGSTNVTIGDTNMTTEVKSNNVTIEVKGTNITTNMSTQTSTNNNVSNNITNTSTNIIPGKYLTVVTFDVGQGLSTLILTPGGYTVLYDCGPNNDNIVKKIKDVGVKTINVLIMSHPHSDHIGSCKEVLEEFKVENVFDNGFTHTTNDYQEVKNLLTTSQYHKIPSDINLVFDYSLTTRFIVPYDTNGYNSNINDNSILFRIDYGTSSILLTGDCEEECENDVINDKLDVEILQIGHHGSSTSTSNNFLNKVSPRLGIISVGDNDYGHPSNITINKLTSANVKIFRTDEMGTIIIRSDGSKWQMGSTT